MPNKYQSEREIVAIVSGFENCTTEKEAFTHVSHLVVGTYYLVHSSPEEAFEKMRSGLLRFLDHHGIDRSKYKDDVTHAWFAAIQTVIAQTAPGSSLVNVINTVVDRLRGSRVTVETE